jgi:phage terminase large subunit-like protein
VTGVACGARHRSGYVSDVKAIADTEIISRRMGCAKGKHKRTEANWKACFEQERTRHSGRTGGSSR